MFNQRHGALNNLTELLMYPNGILMFRRYVIKNNESEETNNFQLIVAGQIIFREANDEMGTDLREI